ncbi:hypothetical protein ACQP2E_07075 [Actinoplanes sp. CA-015351]|uniref:hypothetical protein n=1 Tax=Actinoplanes sp. CA-015351 TaxID=3239897 RepID=UPI003D99CB13
MPPLQSNPSRPAPAPPESDAPAPRQARLAPAVPSSFQEPPAPAVPAHPAAAAPEPRPAPDAPELRALGSPARQARRARRAADAPALRARPVPVGLDSRRADLPVGLDSRQADLPGGLGCPAEGSRPVESARVVAGPSDLVDLPNLVGPADLVDTVRRPGDLADLAGRLLDRFRPRVAGVGSAVLRPYPRKLLKVDGLEWATQVGRRPPRPF